MRTIIAGILLSGSICANVNDLANLYSLSAMDMLYTSKNLKAGIITEANPILGKYPTDSRLMITAVGVLSISTGLYYILPERWRSILLTSAMIIESYFSIDCALNTNLIAKRLGIPEYREASFSFVVHRW